jgi:hypothetical protein
MRVRIIVVLFLTFCMFMIASCKRNHYKVNISSISADIQIKRLESDLFTPDPSGIPASIPSLKEKYGGFLQMFSFIINTGNVSDPDFSSRLVSFVTDKLNNEVYVEVMRHYPEIRTIEDDFENAFRHYLWYFPQEKVPAIITCITGFNGSFIRGDSIIIGLDRYLGRDCEYYPKLGIYKYISARMNDYNIVPDCIYAWGATEWDLGGLKYPADNLLTEMIHEGKLRYFEKCMLPELNDTILFGFTEDQMKFCRNNERQMWQYLIENDLLFSTDKFTIRKLTGEAPFTTCFTNESPGRAAIWLGFRIVESYMMRNSNISLGDLLENTDIQGVLEKAKYNPQ